MKIIIVGCGKVGAALVSQLSDDDHDITVIDVNANKVTAITARYDVMGVTGNGATHDVQQRAGIAGADLLIAVTGADELNLLCCLIAKKTSGCQTIARIKNPQYSVDASYLRDELGLSLVINPEYAAAETMARLLRFPSAMSIEAFAGGKVELLKFRLPESCPLCGVAIKDAMASFGGGVLICTAERDGASYIVKGDFVPQEGDVLSLVASPKQAKEFFAKIKYKLLPVKDAIIVGGGLTTQYLCELLAKTGISLTVFEKDIELAEKLCVDYPHIRVIHADATDRETLLEEGIERCGAFLSLGGSDEENVFLSLFAKLKSKGKLITKIDHIDYDEVIDSLELDAIINPKTVTADNIARFVRATANTKNSSFESLYSVIKGEVVAAEFTIKEGSSLIGVPLAQLKIKKEALIAAIIRDGKVIIPSGNDSMSAGDGVLVVSGDVDIADVADILR